MRIFRENIQECVCKVKGKICSLNFDKSGKLPSLSVVLIFTPTNMYEEASFPPIPQHMLSNFSIFADLVDK